MSISRFKNKLTEEVYQSNLMILENQIHAVSNNVKSVTVIQESIIASILNLFLEPKFRKGAEALKNSPEYKELVQQMEISTKLLNRLTDKLKNKVSEYQKSMDSMQKAGIKVKSGMNPEQMYKEFERWQKQRNKSLDNQKITKIDPAWERILR